MLLKNRWVVVVVQALLILASLMTAWLLRFEFSLPHFSLLLQAAPLLLGFRLLAMRRYNLFHGYWRYTSVRDAADIAKAVAVGSAAFFVVLRFVLGVTVFPLSIYLLEALLTVAALGGVRVLSRMILKPVERRSRDDRSRVLIVGAGSAAELLIRELAHTDYEVVGCVDDDRAKQGVRLHGVQVVGTIDELAAVAAAYAVAEIFIAMPSVTGLRMRRVIERCQASGRKFKTIPGLSDLAKGRVTVNQLRDVDVEDLLGRDPVRLDLEAVRRHLAGQVVMVTGAAGSIGSELCRQILDYAPAKLICLDQAETALFYLQLKLDRLKYRDRIEYCVSDITDGTSMRTLLRTRGVQIIFNAAAYKHVPLMESNSAEAMRNNVFGLLTLLQAAEDAGCERFLLISSDKAVNPTSVMGCTKRLGELILASRPSRMRCVSVRFGNVLGSQGSVVPVFQQQIRKDGQVTVTHREITRFFMTIPEAVSLVLQAFTIGQHGNILVLDMGEPIRILDLARTLIKLSGNSEAEIPVVFSGLRPGEKLYEERFYSSERLLATPHEKVNRTESDLMDWASLRRHLEDLLQLTLSGTEESLLAKVADIIPEYARYRRPGEREPVERLERSPIADTPPFVPAEAGD
ncbi:MAG: polysaccharide biosynthesis protein [Acidobacteria bacterium]|nr:MAG: polysaccharide biosynthesis protein [Acidobacteriota bacterium]